MEQYTRNSSHFLGSWHFQLHSGKLRPREVNRTAGKRLSLYLTPGWSASRAAPQPTGQAGLSHSFALG